MIEFEQYEHHGEIVWVRKDLRGKHREHCLCFKCENFKPGTKENCTAAKLVYSLCRSCDLVTPVWECPRFVEVK